MTESLERWRPSNPSSRNPQADLATDSTTLDHLADELDGDVLAPEKLAHAIAAGTNNVSVDQIYGLIALSAQRELGHLHARVAALEAKMERLSATVEDVRRLAETEFDERLVAAEARAEARLSVIEEQQHALAAYQFSSWQARLRRASRAQLGILYQYDPRAVKLPERYHATSPPPDAPTIAIVTPSFRSGRFIERTLLSVLEQGYPKLELVVQDGGSLDETVAILERYSPNLTAVSVENDDGQADAINRGFARTTGEIMAYLNADDLLLPGSLASVSQYFQKHPDVDVVYGHRIVIDEHDAEIGRWVMPPHDDEVLKWVDYLPQETMFWRRRIWDRCGGAIDPSFHFAMDWDLILRFQEAGAKFVRLPRFLGAFRVHPDQKTSAEIESVGDAEMARLRERVHRRHVSSWEAYQNARGYLLRHRLYHWAWRLGLLQY